MNRSTELSTGFGVAAALLIAALVFASPRPGAAGETDAGAKPTALPGLSDLEAGAEAGDPWAQLNLGAAYDQGLAGVRRDPERAVHWYRRAAGQGLALARFNLAHCLATGTGTPRDDAQARYWMLLAADQGLADAQFLAGVMLAEGLGGRVQLQQARHWLRRAADAGHDDAAALLRRLQDRASPE